MEKLEEIGFCTYRREIAESILYNIQGALNESKMTQSNKTAIANFFRGQEFDIRKAIEKTVQEKMRKWNDIIGKANEIISINEDIEKLRAEKAELEQKFDSPKAREAFLLWQEYLKPFMDSPDAQLKRNAVLSAGRMVAAVFGYTEGYPQKANGNLTE